MEILSLNAGQIGGVIAQVFEIAFAVVALASVITAFTPTPRDDEVVGKLYKFIEALALNVGYAKDRAPNQTGGRFVAD